MTLIIYRNKTGSHGTVLTRNESLNVALAYDSIRSAGAEILTRIECVDA